MKRTDIKKGDELAALAPSQGQGRSGLAFTDARQCIVLDVEPVWRERYTGWYDKAPTANITVLGVKHRNVKDRTIKLEGADRIDGSYAREAKRVVKCLVFNHRYHYGDEPVEPTIEVVPLSQLRMTWAEFSAQKAEAKAEWEAEWERNRTAQEQHEEARKLQKERITILQERFDKLPPFGSERARIVAGHTVTDYAIAGTMLDIESILDLLEADLKEV